MTKPILDAKSAKELTEHARGLNGTHLIANLYDILDKIELTAKDGQHFIVVNKKDIHLINRRRLISLGYIINLDVDNYYIVWGDK